MGVKCVSVVRVELSMLSETSWQIWVGQIVSSKANQVCMIFLQARYCTLPVVSTCKPTHPATMNAAQAHCRQGNSWHCCCNPCKPISSARVPSKHHCMQQSSTHCALLHVMLAPKYTAQVDSRVTCHTNLYDSNALSAPISNKMITQQPLHGASTFSVLPQTHLLQ